MADIKLYSITDGNAVANNPTLYSYEREIQILCEKNLETFFAVRFLATEHSTGSKHKGRIDTLGLDENNCPVIIEYKLDSKENVINQGLFYLDWLMDHKGDFELLCLKKFGEQIEIDWSNPRLLCIARDFTRYDDYAIGQINRNIELIRYRVFDAKHIVFELASTSQMQDISVKGSIATQKYRDMGDALGAASENLLQLYQEVESFIFTLGDDIQKKELKYYHAFSRIKNFVCAELRTRKNEIVLYLRIKYDGIENPTPNIRDVSSIGHYGTGDTEIVISTLQDLENVKELIEESYANN